MTYIRVHLISFSNTQYIIDKTAYNEVKDRSTIDVSSILTPNAREKCLVGLKYIYITGNDKPNINIDLSNGTGSTIYSFTKN